MRFHDLTWPELRNVDRDQVLVVAPIAACEQHSLHLPVFTDTILVTAVAEGVEKRIPQQILLLPTLWLGASHHHLPFGGTLTAPVQLHVSILVELLTPLLDEGHKRLLILNGHGGNIDTMQVALRELQPKYRDRLMTAASYWDLASNELATLAEGSRKTMGHACEFETSMILALRPDLVKRELCKNDESRYTHPTLRGLYTVDDMAQCTRYGSVGYSELATPEKGRKMLDVSIERVIEVAKGLLTRPLPEARQIVGQHPHVGS